MVETERGIDESLSNNIKILAATNYQSAGICLFRRSLTVQRTRRTHLTGKSAKGTREKGMRNLNISRRTKIYSSV